MKFRMLAIVIVLGALAGATTFAAKPSSSTQTGQGIMVNLDKVGTLTAVDNKKYHYNEATAAGYFTNAWDGNAPAVSCKGPGCVSGVQTCIITGPPAPDSNEVNGAPIGHPGAVDRNQCIFLDGGDLIGHSYTQSASCSQGSGKTNATYTDTWTYNVTPTTSSVDPLTAWDLVGESNPDGTVHLEINAEIAGESALSSSKTSLKYSFSLVDAEGNRVQNLALSVDSGTPIGASSTIVTNAPGAKAGDAGALDFYYMTNAGSNGATSLLTNGDARTILNTDSFAGNNDGGADGSALAEAIMTPVPLDIGQGDHTVVLTGTVKGNNALANIGFSVSEIVHVIAPGCSVP